jgi:hypothetical protein
VAYVAADYWQIEYTEGELIVLASLPSAVSTGTGLTYSALSMSGNGASLATGTPVLTARMPILGTGTAQSLLNTSVSISTAIAGNPVAVAVGEGLIYSALTMSANGYAISNSVSTVTMPMPINGQAYASSRIIVEYADAEYWLDGYAESYLGTGVGVSTAIASIATANASGQTSVFSKMAMSASGYSSALGLANVKMALSCSANAFSQSTGYGQVFSTVAVMAMPKASSVAKCRMIKFVGYELPVGTNAISSMTTNYNLSSMTINYDLKTVTPIYSVMGLSNIFDIDSLTIKYNANTLTPQHDIRRLN